jgi:hypothetical protein
MWRNPRYPAPGPATPPENAGELLLSLPRNNGDELRISLDEFHDRKFVSLRLWTRGSGGELWPSAKGVTVRLHEADRVVAAIEAAVDLARQSPRPGPAAGAAAPAPSPPPDRPQGQPGAQEGVPQYVERRRRPQPRGNFDPRDLAGPAGDAGPFNEFEVG